MLNSIVAMLISPKFYVKESSKMMPSKSTMTIFDTFVQSSIPLEVEKEEQEIRDWIYRGEEDDISMVATPISPKFYGKGYTLLQQRGY